MKCVVEQFEVLVLQRVAVCCSVLQCVAVCVVKCIAEQFEVLMLQRVAACCIALQSVAVCFMKHLAGQFEVLLHMCDCNTLQSNATHCKAMQHTATQCELTWQSRMCHVA